MRLTWCLAAVVAAGCLPDLDVMLEDASVDADASGDVADAGAETADAAPDVAPDVAPDAALDAAPDARPDVDAALPDATEDMVVDSGRFEPTGIDRECPAVWADVVDPDGACTGREVTTVASLFQTSDVAIAHEADGRVVVFYSDYEFPDAGRLASRVFDADAASAASAGPAIDPESRFGDVVGTRLRVVTEAPDRHHVAYWLRSDFGSEVRLQTMRGDLFNPATTVAAGVSASGNVAVELDSDARLVVGWSDDGSGRYAARRENADGSFAPPVTLHTSSEPRYPGVGEIAFRPGFGGAVHGALLSCRTLLSCSPMYVVGSATWSLPTTLDNRAVETRSSGVGVDLTTVGDEVVVAYLDWEAGVGEVRIARYAGGDTVATPEVRVSGVFIEEAPGRHPVRIDTDSEGFLHLLTADAGVTTTRTLLQYHRQTLVAGELRWLVDTVAVMETTPAEVYADMKIGADRRPHIVYWDPTMGAIRYATARP